jgi:hypothetical protein
MHYFFENPLPYKRGAKKFKSLRLNCFSQFLVAGGCRAKMLVYSSNTFNNYKFYISRPPIDQLHNRVKENSADRQPVVQLTSPKEGTL